MLNPSRGAWFELAERFPWRFREIAVVHEIGCSSYLHAPGWGFETFMHVCVAILAMAGLAWGGLCAAEPNSRDPTEPQTQSVGPPNPPQHCVKNGESSSAASGPHCPAPADRPIFEGALGPVVSWSVRGGSDGKAGFYLRYKRVSLSNNGNFAVRRPDDIFRGLGLDVVRKDRVSFNLGLRVDRGHRASDVPELVGYDDIASTVRLRASATYHPDPLWSVSASWSGDVLGKGGGQVVDFALSRDELLEPRVHWALGLGLSMGDQRFQQSRFGVTQLQSRVSGLPVYSPGAGLLNASIGTTLRFDISPLWVGFVGSSASHRLGPQLESPLVRDSTNWGVSGGIARRF